MPTRSAPAAIALTMSRAAAERAVDEDFRASGDGLHDLGQHIHGAAAVIELAPAVVRDVNPFHPMVERDPGVLGGGDAFDARAGS